MSKVPPLPLEGLRVLELARILAGPWAGQVLADLGADVIKVESPEGDDTRKWGPPFVKRAEGKNDAAYFHSCNRGKRSIVADFCNSDDLLTVKRLASDADILIENFKCGGLVKFGLDYHSLATENPGLIYCSITGFGQSGPYTNRPGYDFIVQGMSGIMDITGDPGGPPQKIGVALADIITGLYSVIAIEAAIFRREATGEGEHIDMALFDCMTGVLANQGLNYLTSGVSPVRKGNVHPNIAPYETFPTKDGWFVLTVGNDDQFRRFCDAVGLQKLASHDKFATNARRVENREMLSNLISEKTRCRERDELLIALERAKVPAGPINTVEQALNDPQTLARNMIMSLRLGNDADGMRSIRTPIRFCRTPTASVNASPALGADDPKWRD